MLNSLIGAKDQHNASDKIAQSLKIIVDEVLKVLNNNKKDLKETEKVTNRISSNVDYWYDDFYLITETFEVKDRELSFGEKRNVFVQFKKVQIQQ